MDVRIDDLELIKRVDDTDAGTVKEIRAISSMNISDKRSIVELKIPGAEGGILQDLGRHPVLVRFTGEFYGGDAKTTLENLRAKFKSGKPLPFSSDLTTIAEITQVLIENLQVQEATGAENRFVYQLTIREYVPPKEEEEEEPPGQEEDAEDTVEDETEDAVESINYVTGRVVDEKGEPVPDLKVNIADEDGNEYEVTTDADGIYRKDDLPPGKYTVTVKEEGYEDMTKEVEIKGSSEEGGTEEEAET